MIDARLDLLKKYLAKEDSITLAFLFGSRAKKLQRKVSDWDVAVYFKSDEYLELETEKDYPDEHRLWADLVDVLQTDGVDLLVLNRAAPELVFTVLTSGVKLLMRNKGLYLNLLCRTYDDAVDFRGFALDFWEIGEKAASLTEEARFQLLRRLRFLEKEWQDFDRFDKLAWSEYNNDSDRRRSIERWVENLVVASLDIAKIVLASDKELIPGSYKETLRSFGLKYIDEEFAGKFCLFAELRNIIVHEYLDIKWKRIKNFVEEAGVLYPVFIQKAKDILKK